MCSGLVSRWPKKWACNQELRRQENLKHQSGSFVCKQGLTNPCDFSEALSQHTGLILPDSPLQGIVTHHAHRQGIQHEKADIEAATKLQPRWFPQSRGELCRYLHDILSIRPFQASKFQAILNHLFLSVCALCMANVIDNQTVPLISIDDVQEASRNLKQNRCADKNGLTGDCLRSACESHEVCSDLANKFESRSVAAPQDLEQ